VEAVDIRHWLAVKSNEDIPIADTRLERRTSRFHRNDEDAALDTQTVAPNESAIQRHILAGNADVSPTNPAVFNEATGNVRGGVDPDSEADSLRGRNDGCVDPDDFSS
jgi:hypothetical protein